MTPEERHVLEEQFIARLRERWKHGGSVYGEVSFRLPPLATAEEILQEVEDLAGWAFILWCQISERLGAVLVAVEKSRLPGTGREDRRGG